MGETSISPCRGRVPFAGSSESYEIVLGGGGVKGFGHLGFLNAINQYAITTTKVTGVSIGSLVGAFYTNGYSADEMKEIFRQEIFQVRPERLLKALIPNGSGGFGMKPLVDDWISTYGLEPNENLRIVAYNVLQRQPVLFEGVDYDLSVALTASCAVPLIMQPVWHLPLNGFRSVFSYFTGDPIEGLLVDGAMHHPCPDDFCDGPAIIAKLGFASRLPTEIPNIFDAYMHALELAGCRFLNKLFPDSEEHLVIDVGAPDISGLSFGVSSTAHEKMIDFGYSETTRSLEAAGFNR